MKVKQCGSGETDALSYIPVRPASEPRGGSVERVMQKELRLNSLPRTSPSDSLRSAKRSRRLYGRRRPITLYLAIP